MTFASGDVEPNCLEPQRSNAVAGSTIASHYVQSLFYQDTEGKVVPWLATGSTESPDSLSWQIKLRDDVKFSDGTALDAESVKASFEYWQKYTGGGKNSLTKVRDVAVVDPHTVRFDLKEPDSSLLASLAATSTPIMSAESLHRNDDDICADPIGSGPFKIKEWVKQDHVTLVRNDSYSVPAPGSKNPGRPYLDQIVWRYIPDSSTRLAAFESGEVQAFDYVQPEQFSQLEGRNDTEVITRSRPGNVVNIALNSTSGPFTDINVRHAFVDSVDVEAALKSVYFGRYQQARSLLSSFTRFHVNNVDYHYNPDEAARLLDKAGWTGRDSAGYRTKNGQRLVVNIPISAVVPINQGLYDQVQASAQKAGFEVKYRQLESAAWSAAGKKWDYDAYPIYYTRNTADVLRLVYTSPFAKHDGSYHSNSVGLTDPTIDDLLQAAGHTSDDAQRAKLYEQAQDLVVAGYYAIPVFDQTTNIAVDTARLRDTGTTLTFNYPNFDDAWLVQ
ncbi:ABC transporter substrate-binding protein [Gordonia sp. ABSL11-1]|uniref:ABC transporter substrate-binding protein n=1 Tax=Gordonia sp. ABSL11-1 TaxID=3053924 RepID=UPI002572AD94|nr:ABC transporter substrate-binding protein [Gordonia sp. ABSL11-1]MDL9948134.1 ABC transporter substrate-binding protein [Gordonia sp. ABSL11-1]